MKIKRLDIIGFKSFPDKMTLLFDKPIVGVVGPNGCGKSNIVDAIRWVIGEQSMKALRGKSREDIIFAGSESRSPLGAAEVTVTFDNSDRLAPPQYADYNEIAVTRKLYRDGDSDYLLNGAPCRLKDITDLFLGTGVGSKAYSIIEQGRISLIVSSKPEDRRIMIEEAAGITKYRSRKREAERKIDYTRQNLLRIGDIVSELKKQLGSLSRQAKKAERYREFRKNLKELDLRFISHEYRERLERVRELEESLVILGQEGEGLSARFRALETEVEARGLKVAEREAELGDRQEELNLIDQQVRLDERNIEVYETELGRLAERAGEIDRELSGLASATEELARRVEGLETERREALAARSEGERFLQDAERRLAEENRAFEKTQSEAERRKQSLFDAAKAIDRAEHGIQSLRLRIRDNEERTERNRAESIETRKRFDGLEEEKSSYTEHLGGLRQLRLKLDNDRNERNERLEEARRHFVEIEENLSDERDRLASARSRLDSLKELDRSLEGFADGVKAVLQEDGTPFSDGEVIDVLARLIEVDPDYEAAVGSALGERLQWLVTRDHEAGRKGVGFLRGREAGRAGFIPAHLEGFFSVTDLPDGAVRLVDRLTGGEAVRNLGERLLGDVLAADSEDEALELWKRGAGRFGVAAKDGAFVDKSGALVGGSGETVSQTLLRRRRQIQEFGTERERLENVCRELSEKRDEQVKRIRGLEGEMEDIRRQEHNQDIKILEREKDLHHIETQMGQVRERLEALDREFARHQEEMRAFMEERRALEAALVTGREDQTRLEGELKAIQQELGDLSERREASLAEVTERRVASAEAGQRCRHLETELKSAREREADLGGRGERLAFEKKRGQERAETNRAHIAETGESLEKRIQERERLFFALGTDRDRLAIEQDDIRKQAALAKAARADLDENREKRSQVEVRLSQERVKIENLEGRASEKYGITLATEFEEYLTETPPGDDEREEMESLGRRIESMGEVNLTAIKEYDEVSERYQFLLDQEDDLKRSLEMLEEAIRKINRTTRKRFKETFERINRNFSELFPQLFGGGEARLEFTDPQDLLATGIEIIARPPGKKFQSVSLLSGGEKALTAISLIFAIFLYRPTPFCLLDEVDAPLDDANITRFNQTVKRISRTSQFILVTHNKKTMEITNTLYGVTMEEPGISKIVSVNLN